MNMGILKVALKSASIDDKIQIIDLLLNSLKKDQIQEILNKYDK